MCLVCRHFYFKILLFFNKYTQKLPPLQICRWEQLTPLPLPKCAPGTSQSCTKIFFFFRGTLYYNLQTGLLKYRSSTSRSVSYVFLFTQQTYFGQSTAIKNINILYIYNIKYYFSEFWTLCSTISLQGNIIK